MHLTYLVLYVSDIDASRDWYESALGLRFTEEQHSGPVHYSTKLEDGTVVELFPAGDNRPVTAPGSASPSPTPTTCGPSRRRSPARTASSSRSPLAPRRADPAPRWYTDGMEKTQVSEDARRLIAHRISKGESVSRVAYDFGIGEAEVERITASYHTGT